MSVEKMNKPNEGIKCLVNSCHYYLSGDYCSAQKIEVRGRDSTSSDETDCATFISEG